MLLATGGRDFNEKPGVDRFCHCMCCNWPAWYVVSNASFILLLRISTREYPGTVGLSFWIPPAQSHESRSRPCRNGPRYFS